MDLKIQKSEACDFLECWRKTIRQRSSRETVWPYNEKRGALVFSFDVDMKPFLGNHYGWNRLKIKDRTYFSKTPELMTRIGQIMTSFSDREGGRVFIDDKRSYYVDRLLQKEPLCNLIWPEDIDVVSKIRECWLQLPESPKRTMTLHLPLQKQRDITRLF